MLNEIFFERGFPTEIIVNFSCFIVSPFKMLYYQALSNADYNIFFFFLRNRLFHNNSYKLVKKILLLPLINSNISKVLQTFIYAHLTSRNLLVMFY
jgi:hypothetical protein